MIRTGAGKNEAKYEGIQEEAPQEEGACRRGWGLGGGSGKVGGGRKRRNARWGDRFEGLGGEEGVGC
jgi:hypothetical protein